MMNIYIYIYVMYIMISPDTSDSHFFKVLLQNLNCRLGGTFLLVSLERRACPFLR